MGKFVVVTCRECGRYMNKVEGVTHADHKEFNSSCPHVEGVCNEGRYISTCNDLLELGRIIEEFHRPVTELLRKIYKE